MSFIVDVSNTVDEKEWDKKLLESKDSTAYQSSKWAKTYEFFHSIPIFIAVRNARGEMVGQLLSLIHNEMLWHDTNLFARLIGTKLNPSPTLTWFYGPIIYDESHKDEIISKILLALHETAIKNKVAMIKGSSHPLSDQFSNKIFENFGYKLQPWATYIINLNQNPDSLYENLDKKTRYDIRKSEKNSLEFIVANTRSSLDELIELKRQEKRRSREKIREARGFYDSRWNHLHKTGYEKLFLAKHNGETVAAILNIIFNGNVVQHGVSTSSKKELLGGPFLTWNAIKWCINMKHSTYDMGGTNPEPGNAKEKSMNFFKSKWGGKKFDYMRYAKILDNTRWKISSVLKDPKKIKKIFSLN